MNDPEINEGAGATVDWTPERVTAEASPCYPLSETGPLCPLLDDENLLYEFYVTGNLRQEVKRFCKSHRWEGRPQYPYAMTDDALRKLLRSMCNSPDARRTIQATGNSIALHNAIWGWLGNVNKPLFAAAKSCSHENAKGAVFMSPEELGVFLDTPDGDNPTAVRRQKVYVALAFTMLQTETRASLVAQLVNRFPESAVGLGLVPQPAQAATPAQPVSTQEPEPSAAPTVETPPAPATTAEEVRIPPAPLDCWVSHVDHFVAKAEELRRTTAQFAKQATDISGIETLSDFADSGAIKTSLTALDVSRQQILAQSAEVLHSLTSPCAHAGETPCELQRFVEQFQAKPPETITQLTVTAGTMREKAEALVSRAQSARKELRLLKPEAAALSQLLQLPDTSPEPPAESVSPCRVLDAASNQRRIVSELRQKVDAETLRRKDLLIADADRLRKQYDLGAGASFKDCFRIYNDLRFRIEAVEDIEDVQECERQLEDLTGKCRAAEQFDHRKLAGRLKKEPEAISIFLDLCHTLVDQGAPELAYLLLHVRQRVHQFEEIADMPDRSIDLLLETACAVAHQLPLGTLWDSLCAQPWLVSIEHADIQSPDLLERLVVALIGAALAGHEEQASAMLARLGARELARQRFSESLDQVLQAVLAQQPVRLAAPDQLSRIHAQEESLRESISFEGGKYRHIQCGNAHHFARFETVHVFPALAALWQAVSSDLRARRFDAARARFAETNADNWYNQLVRQSEKAVSEHPHFSGKIRAFMQSFVDRLQEHVEYSRQTWEGDELIIARTAFVETLKQWAGNQKARNAVVELVSQTLEEAASTPPRTTPFWRAISLCPTVLLRCPHFATWLRAQQDPTPDTHLEQLLLADLTVDRPKAEAVQVLEADDAWEHLCALQGTGGFTPDIEWKAKLKGVLSEFDRHRHEVQAVKDGRLLALYNACVEGGRLQAARQLLQQCSQRKAEERAEQRQQVTSFADESLKTLDAVKELASAANMSAQWLDNVWELAGKVERQLRHLRRTDEPQEAATATQARLAKAVTALRFLVEQHGSVFDEVEHLLSAEAPKPVSTTLTAADKDSARSKCPALRDAWEALVRTDEPDEHAVRRQWVNFAGEFLKACNLYHDEHDNQRRFTTVPSIKYPFSVFQTAFYKPQSEFLKRPLRLYLYRQREVDLQALQRLEAELSAEDAAAWLHIVFAPQGYERIQRYFKYDTGFKDFLLVDEAFLYRVMLAEKHDVPVRRDLHASVTDLASSSPFVAQGYCHQSNNIYVGRKEVLQKLLNTPQAMIWGGRRIGKTSVLHALENSLRNRNYYVAYVYVDLEDAGNPDLAIARKICSTLDLPPAETIADFERHVAKLRSDGIRLAFLIDEVDEYIKKSRAVHGDAFPLATTLRQLVMDDAAGNTRLVYSGYHQLYHEARLRGGPRRVGHPFINTAQCVSINNLNLDDVKELVTTGFEDLLGVHLAPEVPSLIFRRASGHPAFVQQFCRCLVGWVQNRRSPSVRFTINASDVEAVYATSTTAEGGEQPFIFYVNETLGYNLSHLGRATMIAICDLVGPKKDRRPDDSSFSVKELHTEIGVWCDVAHLSPPDPTHLTQTVDLLVMTNMLTQDPVEQDRYRVTYPAYIDILKRLGQLGRAQIEQSLAKYDAEERQNGVIL